MQVRTLVGAGDKIAVTVLPVVAVGVAANVLHPEWFSVGGPSPALRVASAATLVPGVTTWVWSVALIVTKVPRRELITAGPYRLVRHPLYTGVALLVLPWVGFLLDTWLGAAVGVLVYGVARVLEREEDAELARSFGPSWQEYRRHVKVPWL